MKKIAFVVQRYGEEVNGGAELHCRQYAERMKDKYDVEVLTTCAIDYVTWADEYPEGKCSVNGVTVRRFKVAHERNSEEFNKLSSELVSKQKQGREYELQWMDCQGPASTDLIEYIKTHKSEYDVFVFYTYIYYQTFFGMQVAADKTVLMPTAHDEWPIYFGIYKDVFTRARAIFYNTVEEKEFVEKLFHNENIPNNGGHGGVGVDLPAQVDANRFKNKYGLDDYIIYVGRIDESKGCDELFSYFEKYKESHSVSTKLVLLGKSVIDIPARDDVVSLGFVSDEDKFDGIAGAKLLILPSHYESLSMVVLEAMSLGVPVIVNGKCEVLKGHCERSNAGLYYTNYEELEEALTSLLSNPELCACMGERGKKYVEDNYNWDRIFEGMDKLIEIVT